ncbi:MAG: hypothetical protein F6K21_32855 [Symploca sp. SIO2D2]|nr:hypothetical protein [Symploca sp. SIO2D2]
MTHFTVQTLMRWARRRHPKKSLHWIYQKYFGIHEGYQWTFTKEQSRVIRHSETKVKRRSRMKKVSCTVLKTSIKW